jgi:hypothetical protein
LVEKNMGNEGSTYKKFKWHGWNFPNDLNYTYRWNWSNNELYSCMTTTIIHMVEYHPHDQ